jgi:hypothetical protein
MKTKTRHMYKKNNRTRKLRSTRNQRISKNVVGYLERSKLTKKHKLTKRRKLTKSKFKGAGNCSNNQCINENQPQLQIPLPLQSVSSPSQLETFYSPHSQLEKFYSPHSQLEKFYSPHSQKFYSPPSQTSYSPPTQTSYSPQLKTFYSPVETPLSPQQIETPPLPPPSTNPKDTLNALIQDRENNMGKMLNVACKNPDNCLALGVYGSYIKRYFENFRNLSLIDNRKIKRIGSVSANGFIIEIPFTKNSFTAYTALKCAANPRSDNLFYEYYVGKFFINNYINIFPCFVETYDCYTFDDERSWSTLKNLTTTNRNNIDLTNMITRKQISEHTFETNYDSEDNDMFGLSCIENKNLCVLIQHFDNFRSVHDEYNNNYGNILYEFLNILYQVYFPLTILKDVYTHYDLHANNVFLYKPYEGKKYIQMRYHLLSKKIIEFPSEYIVKIIDYGRNYFDNGITNTKKILNNYVCNNPRCNTDCGENFGYSIIQGNEYYQNIDFHWIFPNKKNISHDLRFAVFFYSFFKDTKVFNEFYYGNKLILSSSKNIGKLFDQTGTPEKLGGDHDNIYNIVNLRDFLERKIESYDARNMKKKYDDTWKKMAIMDIYEDKRPYTFELLPYNS